MLMFTNVKHTFTTFIYWTNNQSFSHYALLWYLLCRLLFTSFICFIPLCSHSLLLSYFPGVVALCGLETLQWRSQRKTLWISSKCKNTVCVCWGGGGQIVALKRQSNEFRFKGSWNTSSSSGKLQKQHGLLENYLNSWRDSSSFS